MLKLDPKEFIDLRLMNEALTAALAVLDPASNPDEVFKICKALKNIKQVETAIEAGNLAFSNAFPSKLTYMEGSEFLIDRANEHRQDAINSVLDPEGVLAARHELTAKAYEFHF